VPHRDEQQRHVVLHEDLRFGRTLAFLAVLGLPACSTADVAGVVPEGAADAGGVANGDASPAEDGAPPAESADAEADGAPEKDIDQIPWETGANVGFGVAKKDTGNPRGSNVFIAYAGFHIDLEGAKAWSTALYRASLQARGVRWIWAVQGPNTPGYDNAEIGNSKVVAAVVPAVSASTKFVLVAGHSSGSFVAHELLGQLASGVDLQNVTANRVVYFNLDGGKSGLTTANVARLRKAYFVGARDPAVAGTSSLNFTPMTELATQYGSGGFFQIQATGSGCNSGATFCLHLTCITTKPHDPTGNGAAEIDYTSFAGRAVVTSYIDEKATEASLVP
jgi:hypothetical protein